MFTITKNKVLVFMVAVLMAALAFTAVQAITAEPAEATYDRSCYPWGGFTYHKHWNLLRTWYHGSDHFSYYNDFYIWDSGFGNYWAYNGWDYCY
jgi:hypothetical protein